MNKGRDPDDIDYSGTDIERKVSNQDTLRQQWEEFWEVCHKDESGQLPGKTIVFAMTQEHALRLADAFEEMFPQYPGLVQVITYKSEYHGTLIDNFKKKKPAPNCYLCRYARNRSKRARSNEPGIHAPGAFSHQVGANDRARHTHT